MMTTNVQYPWCILGASLIPEENDSARAAHYKQPSQVYPACAGMNRQ